MVKFLPMKNRVSKTAAIQYQAIFWVAAAAAIVIDQLTKFRVEAKYALGESAYPFPAISDFFRIIHVSNTGAAWGLLEGFGWVFSIIAFVVAVYLLLVNRQITGRYALFRVILGMIAGGAIGNAIDRVRLGHVTDYIDFNFRPFVSGTFLDRPFLDIAIFNWADVFIIGGVFALAFLMLTDQVPDEEPEPEMVPPQPTPPKPFSRPTTLIGYDAAISPPSVVDTNLHEWRQARGVVLVGGLIVVSLSIWFVSWGISSRASRRSSR